MRTCSRSCGVRIRCGPKRRQDRTPNVACAHCGTLLWRKASLLKRWPKFFCGRRCNAYYQQTHGAGENNPNFRDAGWRVCVGCGTRYKSYTKTRRYCSVNCGRILAAEGTVANLRRGADAERRCANELRDLGYVAVRSAASRSPFDVIAIRGDEILLVQVKRTKAKGRMLHGKTRRELETFAVPDVGCVKKQLWCWLDRAGWTKTEIVSSKVREVTAADFVEQAAAQKEAM